MVLRTCAALFLFAAAARGEEIRIEIARGLPKARVEVAGRVQTVTGPAEFSGPLKLDGRELSGRLELIADKSGLVAVNVVDLEDYVAAVVASEVPAGWPADALRAQAVAARTFAVAQKVAQGAGARAHLGASVLDQVFKGTAHPEPGALAAARETAGEVLTWGAAPIAAYFSASCGGRSESAEAAFHLAPGAAPYLHGSEDDPDEREWTRRLPLSKITESLRNAKRMQAEILGLRVATRTGSGRANSLSLKTRAGVRSLAAVELRQLVGYSELPSLYFEVTVEGGEAIFRGKGSGHGVGLCQWGAYARAKRGEPYRQILAHYYPGAELRRMY